MRGRQMDNPCMVLVEYTDGWRFSKAYPYCKAIEAYKEAQKPNTRYVELYRWGEHGWVLEIRWAKDRLSAERRQKEWHENYTKYTAVALSDEERKREKMSRTYKQGFIEIVLQGFIDRLLEEVDCLELVANEEKGGAVLVDDVKRVIDEKYDEYLAEVDPYGDD